MENRTILVAEHIDKRFGITHAVNNVSLTVAAGEIRGLIGENGSGKSTFCQMLCGIYSIGAGTFTLDGKELNIRNQVDANNAGIAIIVQEMGTLSGLTVAENIFLGHEEPFMHKGIKDTRAMNREAQKLLDEYGFGRIKAGVMIDHYNFEDRKLVEIVKATYMKPKILVILTVFYSDPAEKKELEKLAKENEKLFRKASFLNPVHPVVCREKAEPPFQTAKEMEAFCKKKRCSIWQAAVKYEAAISGWSEKAVFDYATELWDICLEGIGRGAEGNFDINGMITPKANQLLKKYINKKNKKFFPAGILDFAVPLSLGVMEYSNSAGIIVCLPTGGSSGIVPAAIYSAAPDVSAMVKAFLTAGVIGVIMARTNNFSGGGLGCQAEIGCGAAMAAGALVQLLGGTVRQACDAASMTLQCLSGLVCDPVAGTVQVPCIARNMSATATAFVCANAVMAGFDPVIPFDEEHDAFVTIGKIVCKCKGIGATTTPTGQKIAAELQKKYTKSRKV